MINYGLRTMSGKITKDLLRYYVLLQYYPEQVIKYKDEILNSIDTVISSKQNQGIEGSGN